MQRPDEPVTFWSALVKYYVPTVIERAVHDLSVVLGARFYLRSEQHCGMFQKILRDLAIVSVFEGSNVVNLGILSSQLARRPPCNAVPGREEERIHELYDLALAIAVLTTQSALEAANLGPRGRRSADCGSAGKWPERALPRISIEVRKAILEGVIRLRERASEWEREFEPARHQFDSRPHAMTPEVIGQVERYCRLHAAAACFHIWSQNGSSCGAFLGRGHWLVLCLERFLAHDHRSIGGSPPLVASVAEELVDRYHSDRSYSIIPHRLSPHSAPETAIS